MTMRFSVLRLSLWIGLIASALCPVAGAWAEPIDVSAQSINRFDASGKNRFGVLEFRGGLVLSSSSSDFGGISGLSLNASGSDFIAVTDKGNWLYGTLQQDRDRPVGMANVQLVPMQGPQGQSMSALGAGDVEALARAPEGYVIGVERQHGIWLFPGDDPLNVRAEPLFSKVPRPDPTKSLFSIGPLAALGSNEGIEALLVPPPGSGYGLIAVGEESQTDTSVLPGFLFSALRGGSLVGEFAIDRIDDFSATDLALAADGRVYLLERRFDMLRGVAMRIRRFPLSDIKPGARIRGEILIEANRLASIDNMEAMAIHRNVSGETILTLMSDNNFSALQRTLLLRFAVLR